MKLLLFTLTLLTGSMANAQTASPCLVTFKSAFTATAVASVALPANPVRKCLYVTNTSGGSTLQVGLSNATIIAGEGMYVATQSNLQFNPAPGSSVWVRALNGAVPGYIIEGR